MIFSRFIELCNHHNFNSVRTFPLPQRVLSSPFAVNPHSFPQSKATTDLILVFINNCLFWIFPINGIIHYVLYYVLILSPVWSFDGHPYCGMNQNSVSLYCWIVFYCMEVSCFIYPFTSWWTFGLFPVWRYKQCCVFVAFFFHIFSTFSISAHMNLLCS